MFKQQYIFIVNFLTADFFKVHAVCRGEQKQNNHTRALTSALTKGLVPNGWIRYTVPKGITVMAWIADFAERVNQLSKFATSGSLKVLILAINEIFCSCFFILTFQKETVWLGGMFAPEAYITATRQLVAQSNQWSLEELNIKVEIGVTEDKPDTFRIEGSCCNLVLLCAACRLFIVYC